MSPWEHALHNHQRERVDAMRFIGLLGGLIGFLLAVAAAALSAAQFMPAAWYVALQKPEWTPPNSIFAPVWTTLYVLIALAGWLVWWRGKPVEALAWRPLSWWGIGLIFNAMWSWLFLRAIIG